MKEKITIALEENILARIDREVKNWDAKNRSAAIQSHLIKFYGDYLSTSVIIFAHDYKWDNRDYPFSVPKALIWVRGKNLITRQIESFLVLGITDIHISIPSGESKIFESTLKLQFPHLVFHFYENDQSTQTWDALRYILKKWSLWDMLIISNWDIFYWSLDVKKYLNFYYENKYVFTFCLKFVMTPEQLGNVIIQGDKVIDFVEKPNANASFLTNSWMYITSKEFMEKHDFWSYLETDFFPHICRQFNVWWFLYSGEWEHIQNDSTYERVNWYLL